MASKSFTPEEVLAFLDEDDCCDAPDQQEIFTAGSDEEFDVLEDIDYGKNIIFNYCNFNHTYSKMKSLKKLVFL